MQEAVLPKLPLADGACMAYSAAGGSATLALKPENNYTMEYMMWVVGLRLVVDCDGSDGGWSCDAMILWHCHAMVLCARICYICKQAPCHSSCIHVPRMVLWPWYLPACVKLFPVSFACRFGGAGAANSQLGKYIKVQSSQQHLFNFS